MGGYATLDLRVERAFAKKWLVQARIANLLDKRYETASYYNQAGRNFFITLRTSPANHPHNSTSRFISKFIMESQGV